MLYEVGELFEVTSGCDLYVSENVSEKGSGCRIRLHPGDLGIMLKDEGGWLSGHDAYLLFAWVFIRGTTGWIVDHVIRKVDGV